MREAAFHRPCSALSLHGGGRRVRHRRMRAVRRADDVQRDDTQMRIAEAA